MCFSVSLVAAEAVPGTQQAAPCDTTFVVTQTSVNFLLIHGNGHGAEPARASPHLLNTAIAIGSSAAILLTHLSSYQPAPARP